MYIDMPRKCGKGIGASHNIPSVDERTEFLEMIQKHAEQNVERLVGRGIHKHNHGKGLSDLIEYYLSDNTAIQPNAGQVTTEDRVLEEHPILFNTFASEEAKSRANRKQMARLKREKKVGMRGTGGGGPSGQIKTQRKMFIIQRVIELVNDDIRANYGVGFEITDDEVGQVGIYRNNIIDVIAGRIYDSITSVTGNNASPRAFDIAMERVVVANGNDVDRMGNEIVGLINTIRIPVEQIGRANNNNVETRPPTPP
jgi:hypothetical protein